MGRAVAGRRVTANDNTGDRNKYSNSGLLHCRTQQRRQKHKGLLYKSQPSQSLYSSQVHDFDILLQKPSTVIYTRKRKVTTRLISKESQLLTTKWSHQKRVIK